MKTKELLSKRVGHIFQHALLFFKVSQKNQLQIIVGVLTVFAFSSCKEHVATGITLAFLPEMLFGIFIAVIFILAIIGGIIHLFTGGDKK